MPKVFDPEKSRKEAQSALDAANTRKVKATEKIAPLDEKVTAATEALARAKTDAEAKVVKAVAAAQTRFNKAVARRQAAQERVDAEDRAIAVAQGHLDRTAPAQVVAPAGVESDEAVGAI